jgi:hypothetical protein
MLELKYKLQLLSRCIVTLALVLISYLLLQAWTPVNAQPGQRALCQNGELITYDPSITGTSCQDRFGVPAVSNEIFYRCDGLGTVQERVTCIGDPSIDDGTGAPAAPPGSTPSATELRADCTTLDDCGIVRTIRLIINVLSGVVGVVVVSMIVLGGIQYSAARDNAQGVSAAKERITNALLALVVYLGMTAFLQWVVPGGVFSG